MPELRAISGWHDIVLSLLDQGQTLQMAAVNAHVPITRIFNEMQLNPEFKTKIERRTKRGTSGQESGRSDGVITGVRTAPMPRG